MKKFKKIIAIAISSALALPISAQNIDGASLNSIISSLEGLSAGFNAPSNTNGQINSIQSLSSPNNESINGDGINGSQINGIQELSSPNNESINGDGINGSQINGIQELSSPNNESINGDGINGSQINGIQELSSPNNESINGDGINGSQINGIQELSAGGKKHANAELQAIIARLKVMAKNEENLDAESYDQVIKSLSNLSSTLKRNSLKDSMRSMQSGGNQQGISHVSDNSTNEHINNPIQGLSASNNNGDGINGDGINDGISSSSIVSSIDEAINSLQSLSGGLKSSLKGE